MEEFGHFVKTQNNNLFIYTIVTRFTERKGIHDAINAFSNTLKTNLNIQLRIVGDGPYKIKLIEQIKTLKIEKKWFL